VATPQYRPRPLHRPEEFWATAFIGGGMLLIITVFLLSAATVGNQTLTSLFVSLMVLGLLLFFGGIILWLSYNRPWHNFDDWSTPMYTGHEHHDNHHVETVTEPHHDAVVTADVQLQDDAVRYGEVVAAAEHKSPVHMQPSSLSDDLTLIEGIGPKIAGALNAAGIVTFAQLAEQSPAALEKIVRGAGVRMVGHAETWAQQAALAAQGRFDELHALQKQLTAGRNK
jgi:predicted flap endonuclease-1-like 5' DNA nuclease